MAGSGYYTEFSVGWRKEIIFCCFAALIFHVLTVLSTDHVLILLFPLSFNNDHGLYRTLHWSFCHWLVHPPWSSDYLRSANHPPHYTCTLLINTLIVSLPPITTPAPWHSTVPCALPSNLRIHSHLVSALQPLSVFVIHGMELLSDARCGH